MTQNSARTGKLYVVGTPIGNLGDLSPRVGEAFAAADANQDIRTLNILVLSQFGHILIRRFMAINDFFDDFQ